MPTSMMTYPVVDDADVFVDVFVGQGQPGGSTVMLGNALLASGETELRDVRVGRGAELRGQKLVVVSATEDKSQLTDRTSATVDLRGGVTPKSLTQEQSTTGQNDTVTYIAIISFA